MIHSIRIIKQVLLSLSHLGLILGFLGACGGGGQVGKVIQRADELPSPPVSSGFLKLPQTHPSVWIYIDGRFKGRVGDYPLRALLLTVGKRRLELRRHGHASVYHLIQVSSAEPVTILDDPLELPEPPPQPQW